MHNTRGPLVACLATAGRLPLVPSQDGCTCRGALEFPQRPPQPLCFYPLMLEASRILLTPTFPFPISNLTRSRTRSRHVLTCTALRLHGSNSTANTPPDLHVRPVRPQPPPGGHMRGTPSCASNSLGEYPPNIGGRRAQSRVQRRRKVRKRRKHVRVGVRVVSCGLLFDCTYVSLYARRRKGKAALVTALRRRTRTLYT